MEKMNFKTIARITYCLLVITAITLKVKGQTLEDDFNRTNSGVVGSGWSETETAASGAQINNNRLQLGSTISGREFVYKDFSGCWQTVLSLNPVTITWAFNMRQTRSDPSGFDSGNYGMAFILGKTTADVTDGVGYAVVLGQAGSTDAIRLVKFSNGPDLNSNFSNIISSGDYGNEYLSIKVTYNSSGNIWCLFVESGTASFPQSDPRNTSQQTGVATADNTYTNSDLRYCGCFWNHSTSSSDNAVFDDIYRPAGLSAFSDIVSADNEASGISYISITGNSINSITDAVRVWSFTIRDGGGGYDTDAQGTVMTSVNIEKGTYNGVLCWACTIRQAALYCGSDEIAEITVNSETLSFTSLNGAFVTASDGGSKTIDLYLSFETSPITDHQQFQFKIASVTADPSGSGFANTDAGGAYSSVTGDNNRIQVTATKLAFVQQPSNTMQNMAMNPAVTLESCDLNNNRDADITGTVSLLSTGTLSGTPVANLVNGFGAFTDIIHADYGLNIYLTASLTGLTAAESNNFDILQKLSPGSIAIIAYASDAPDRFAFVSLVDIQDSTQINFTDNGWKSDNTFRTGENTGTWTAPFGGITKGTVIEIEGTVVTGGGSMSNGLTGLSTEGDQILAYQGSSSDPGFVTALNIDWNTWQSDASGSTTSALPSDLVNLTTALACPDENGYYNGPVSGSAGFLQCAICNPANWSVSANNQVWPSWSFNFSDSTIINQDVTVQNLTVPAGETVTINPGKLLKVNGNTELYGTDCLIIKSGSIGTGTFIDNGAISGTGSAKVERYLSGNKFHLISLPVSNMISAGNGAAQTGTVFLNCTLDYYNEASNSWVGMNSSCNVTPDKGYVTKYVYSGNAPADRILLFSGNLNTGNKSYTITCNGQGYNLIGNPYPSAVDWDASSGWTRNTLINNYGYDIWIWNEDAGSWGTYKSGNAGIGTNGASNIISVGQGFFVKAASGGSITMTNAVRSEPGGNFLKNLQVPDNMLRLRVSTGTYYDEVILKFDTLNGIDAGTEKWFSLLEDAPEFYTVNNGQAHSISILPSLNTVTTVPLFFLTGSTGQCQISREFIQSFDPSVSILLEDIKTGTIVNLWQDSIYSFTAAVTDDISRFLLHFSPVITFNCKDRGENVIVFSTGTDILIMPCDPGICSEIELYGTTGKKEYYRIVYGENCIRISTGKTSCLYLLRFHYNGKTFVKKVITGI
jgi:hypothetical protein